VSGKGGDVARFLEEHEERISRLELESHEGYWESATTGSEEASERYARAVADTRRLYADRGDAERVRGWLRDEGDWLDPITRRQLVLLDHEYTGNALDEETIEELTARETELQRIFTNFRAELDGETLSDNQLREILRTERDQDRRRRAWEASKQIAPEVADRLLALVRRRNEAARSLGFPDFYRMALTLQEHDEETLFGILDEFERRTEESFTALRRRIDERLAERNGIAADEVRPWHWEDFFGQEAPSVGDVELDRHFEGVDQEALAKDFFAGVGLPVEGVMDRSDLYEREGKSQHAFCIHIDRSGDVRMLCNLRPNEHWTMVLFHELGHAVYDDRISRDLPYLLRAPAHTFTTEAIAMYFGRLTKSPAWLADALGVELDAREIVDVEEQLRTQMLVATRWMLVMAHFERALYANPDRDDLNDLWWELVERFQKIRRPEGRDAPDWAAKIHLSAAPVYYHNYLLGELTASQLSATIDREVRKGDAGSITGDDRVGRFLEKRFFAPGASLRWDELVEGATGEPLGVEGFVRDFVG
jgi:peptidyl-dipeptidase A